MIQPTVNSVSFLHRSLPSELEGLADLALDLRFGSDPTNYPLWQRLAPEEWERTRNPFMILQNVSEARLDEAARNEELTHALQQCLERRSQSLASPSWFDQRYSGTELKSVAYFSMEFGLSEALPIYSGGLGILAGDHLKTASDMGVPITGVGLLYQQGYFRQILDAYGWQLEAFPYNDPTSLPIVPAQQPGGGWLRIGLDLPGRTLLLRVWKARVGRTPLYLLDSNDPLNTPWDRAITSTLYPSGHEQGMERRLLQEIVLGVGGWRMLEALGIEPEVCHLNEGHAAFVVLARAQSFMRKTGQSFPVSLWATRAGNVFTTHTAVAAGFDRFDRGMIRPYAQVFAQRVGVSVDELLELGRLGQDSQDDRLNMAALATHGSGCVNAVSQLHERVSREIFQDLYPRWPRAEVPVGHITNGVHTPTWRSPEAYALWSRACGGNPWSGDTDPSSASLSKISDTDLWTFRTAERHSLIEYVRRRLIRQSHEHGASEEAMQRIRNALDSNALTLGFARRFATYKRPNLLLYDADRFARLLRNPTQPVQLIVAGKAHPNDEEGKRLVQTLAHFAAQPDLCDRVVFLEDYDVALMQQMAAGVDVWINTPLRPWEACGTSGMKLLANGGLSLSVLDGWWAEAYTSAVGWALGEGQEYSEAQADPHEAAELYDLLENQIVPEFYDRDAQGAPTAWIPRVRASMSELAVRFTSRRMMREYVEQTYLPAARAYRRRAANEAEVAHALKDWHDRVNEAWQGLRFGDSHVTEEQDSWRFEVQVYFGEMAQDLIRVELYADPQEDGVPTRREMTCQGALPGASGGYVYTALVPATRPAEHYTPRIVPYHPEAQTPLENAHILWQR